jgi:hypothetical protein
MANSDIQLNQILLAESSPLEAARIRFAIDKEFQPRISVIKNFNNLIENITKKRPQIVVLGKIDKDNYFETCEELYKIYKDLPVILISKQEVVSKSFHQAVKFYDIVEFVSNDFIKLNQLLQELSLHQQDIDEKSPEAMITGESMLLCLEEISKASSNYFGELAQGNYWRKAHSCTVKEFPFILNWSVNHFGKISCDESISKKGLTEKDIQSLRFWVQAFVAECERIITNYTGILNDSDISSTAKNLLSD